MWKPLSIFVLASVLSIGCGSPAPVEDKVDETRMRLQALSGAYFAANAKLNRAPKEQSDLLPFLGSAQTPEDKKKEAFRSAHDGEDFVVVWGTDLIELAKNGQSTSFVLIYERRGKNGMRYVLKPPVEVSQISEEAFLKEKFPEGHNPNQN